MSNEQQLIALKIEITQLQEKTERMRKLSTFNGFYEAFFQTLPSVNNHMEAFEQLNEEFYQLFGYYRYSNYDSYKHMVSYYLKKNK